ADGLRGRRLGSTNYPRQSRLAFMLRLGKQNSALFSPLAQLAQWALARSDYHVASPKCSGLGEGHAPKEGLDACRANLCSGFSEKTCTKQRLKSVILDPFRRDAL
ncbi:hypothetical protein, partial [Mesorhizobium sp.]|uniref:hypothetical protein n=1 Tax=Mesorhizobium sp. TaxID=1871066 RepID=UPI0025B816FC